MKLSNPNPNLFFLIQCCFQVIISDSVRSVLVVESYHHLVIVQENGVDKSVNQHLPVGLLPHIQLAEAVEPEGHKLGTDLGFRQFFAGNLSFQFLFCGFQFFQTTFRRLGQIPRWMAFSRF